MRRQREKLQPIVQTAMEGCPTAIPHKVAQPSKAVYVGGIHRIEEANIQTFTQSKRHRKFWLAAMVGAAMGFQSCQPPAPPPPVKEAPTWDLDQFEKSSHLLIALTKAEVKVSKTQTVSGVLNSEIEILVKETGQSLPAGEVFARYIEAPIRGKIEKIQGQIAQTEAEIQQQLEIEIPKKLLELEESIQAAEEAQRIQSQLDKDQALANNPVLGNVFAPKIQKGMAPEQLALLKKQKQHFEKRKDSPPPALQETLGQLRGELEKLEKVLDAPELAMPFGGTLHILLPGFHGTGTYPAQDQQPLAQCDHRDSLLFYLDASTPYLTDTPSKQLALRHSPVGRDPVLATFSSSKVTWANNQRQRFLKFQPPAPGAYQNHTDTYLKVEVLQKLGQPCHIVPKLALLGFVEVGAGKPDWNRTLQKLQPGCQIVAEGPNSLAIKPPPSTGTVSPPNPIPPQKVENSN